MSHSEQAAAKRPKGILKNPSNDIVPGHPLHPTDNNALAQTPTQGASEPTDDLDLTLQNTLQNAGKPRRNSSQNARSSVPRRTSSTAAPSTPGMGADATPENAEAARLKWDEANLYLTEQERGNTMKITEPKTPYAPRYDPGADEEEMRTLDAQSLNVDELDKKKEGRRKESDIPGLDIGEPEEQVDAMGGMDDRGRVLEGGEGSAGMKRSESGGSNKEKSVQVDEEDAKEHEGDRRHRDFEEMRKRHYEMRGVKGILGHSAADLIDEDDDDNKEPPPMPKLDKTVVNGA